MATACMPWFFAIPARYAHNFGWSSSWMVLRRFFVLNTTCTWLLTYEVGIYAVPPGLMFLKNVARHCLAGLQIVASLKGLEPFCCSWSRHFRAGLQIVASLRDSFFSTYNLHRHYPVGKRGLLVSANEGCSSLYSQARPWAMPTSGGFPIPRWGDAGGVTGARLV